MQHWLIQFLQQDILGDFEYFYSFDRKISLRLNSFFSGQIIKIHKIYLGKFKNTTEEAWKNEDRYENTPQLH